MFHFLFLKEVIMKNDFVNYYSKEIA